MNREQNERNDNGNIEQDVFAEVLKTACAALYGDTATRRLAAGDIIHALASAYPGVGAAKGSHGVTYPPSEASCEAGAMRGETRSGEPQPTGWDRFLTVAPGLKLQRFAAPGQQTLYVGKRVLPDQTKNPAQVFEVRVDRGCGGSNVWVCENGRGLFTMSFGGAQGKREYLAVKALKALLAARRRDHAKSRRRLKNRAKRADGCPF